MKMMRVLHNGVEKWVEAKPRRIGLGDAIAAIATPIASALKLKCIDPGTQQPRPDSKCAKRKQKLNAIRL